MAGCEEAPAPGGAPDPVELGIVGEWRVTEYLTWQEAEDGTLERVDKLLEPPVSLTMKLTEDRWVFDWDYATPYDSWDNVVSGTYELLDDSRFLLESDQGGGGSIVQYSVDASRLRLELKSSYPSRVNVISARRM